MDLFVIMITVNLKPETSPQLLAGLRFTVITFTNKLIGRFEVYSNHNYKQVHNYWQVWGLQ